VSAFSPDRTLVDEVLVERLPEGDSDKFYSVIQQFIERARGT